jgi:hypothetical protein
VVGGNARAPNAMRVSCTPVPKPILQYLPILLQSAATSRQSACQLQTPVRWPAVSFSEAASTLARAACINRLTIPIIANITIAVTTATGASPPWSVS